SQNCGGDTSSSRPNNVWGWGRLNAAAAVSATFSLTPTAALTYTWLSTDTLRLDASTSTDPETPGANLLARWDFGGDGMWDTPWSLTKVLTGAYTTVGSAVAVQVADPGGRIDASQVVILILDSKSFLPIVSK
ncbi:MAG: hypothetical protein ACRDGG_06575, partial [Anaerolineae bacterium]